MKDTKSKLLPYSMHEITEDDILSVNQTLLSGFLTQGPEVGRFEEALTKVTGAKYAIAVSNGTAALHLAVKALGHSKQSLGLAPAISFAATSNAFLYNDFSVHFVDVEPKTGLMNITQLERDILRLHSEGRPVKAVIPVHYAGQPVDMKSIDELRKKYHFSVIEDAAHALGAFYANRQPVGCCQYSDMTIFSFHPAKHIATGEGGAIVTNDPHIRQKLLQLRNHGITHTPENFMNVSEAMNPTSHEPNPWYYEIQDLGFNYRISDILCALGRSQLSRLKKYVEQRKKLAAHYSKMLSNNPLFKCLNSDVYGQSSFHLNVIEVVDQKLQKRKAELMKELRKMGIVTQVHYIPIPMHPFYQKQGHPIPPNALDFYRRVLSLPLFTKMEEADVNFVVNSLNDAADRILLS